MTKHRQPARWKYLINGLVLLAPVWFLYDRLTPAPLPAPWPEHRAGPVTAAPRPLDDGPPHRHDGMFVKDFRVRLCEGCAARIRSAHLRAAPAPPTIPADAAGVLHGHGAARHVHAPYPPQPGADDRLWLTVQTWDGEVHHASWPLPERP
ncbi:hypothetical protein [Thiohalorhabdus methylotrophus]|uniref:Uncharacterized protein n=1 Tax=Thiohalorhabdus methylotrophus TaxID=3242694 RepID=A0ABV4TZW9_9GAMM